MTTENHDYETALAELAVRFGANVQPEQIVAVDTQPGKEALTRAVADAAYAAGAKFVDVVSFDPYVKRSRLLRADPGTIEFVPPWIGARVLALGEQRAATITLRGSSAPHALDGIDPALAGRDMLPAVKEQMQVVNDRSTNWTIIPSATKAWAALVHPSLEPDDALIRLREQLAHVCRLDEPDPVAAWDARLPTLLHAAGALTDGHFDRIILRGPGTDLTIGLLPSSRWVAAETATVDGIVHRPNLPTEEVFTTPDPQRADGVVTATKPLFVSGTTITGLTLRFEGGRAVAIDADQNAEVLRRLAARDENACRLGELALVDRSGRVGPLQTVFYDTLLDENAASHIALGTGLNLAVEDEQDWERVNRSEIHIDFMVGSDDVEAVGVTTGGEEVSLLRGGVWQI